MRKIKRDGLVILLLLWSGTAPQATDADVKTYQIPENTQKLFHENIAWTGVTTNASCYAFHFKSITNTDGMPMSLVMSAGHCDAENSVHTRGRGRSFPVTLLKLDTGHTRNPLSRDDIFFGLVEDQRINPNYFDIDENINLFALKEEIVTVAEAAEVGKLPVLQKLEFLYEAGNHLVFRAEKPILGGFSGAPVVTKSGVLLGFIIEIVDKDQKILNVFSIKRILELYRALIE